MLAEQILKDVDWSRMVSGACPVCGGRLAREEGCMVCHSCGWSACS